MKENAMEEETKGALFKGGLLILILAGIAAAWLLWVFFGPNDFHGVDQKAFFVSRGQPFSAIVDSLASQGIIRDRGLFSFVVKMRGGTTKLQVGKYIFKSGVSNNEVYTLLKTGRGSVLIQTTIPEGMTARAQGRLLNRVLGIDSSKYAELVFDTAFVHSVGVAAPSLEGYLFPQTYLFPWQPDEKEVIKRLVTQFEHFFSDSLLQRAYVMGWDAHKTLTMASLVEGEAMHNDERPLIAGVYLNRLRRGMRLQADPTVVYIMQGGPRRVHYRDLGIDSPYNTYRHYGLPPGPVNNPGAASILASLYPVRHNYLYFVANGTGRHTFTSTYEQHMREVRLMRRRREMAGR